MAQPKQKRVKSEKVLPLLNPHLPSPELQVELILVGLRCVEGADIIEWARLDGNLTVWWKWLRVRFGKPAFEWWGKEEAGWWEWKGEASIDEAARKAIESFTAEVRRNGG